MHTEKKMAERWLSQSRDPSQMRVIYSTGIYMTYGSRPKKKDNGIMKEAKGN